MTLVNLCIVMASFMLQGRSEKLTESLWPRKPKKITIWPFKKKFAVAKQGAHHAQSFRAGGQEPSKPANK